MDLTIAAHFLRQWEDGLPPMDEAGDVSKWTDMPSTDEEYIRFQQATALVDAVITGQHDKAGEAVAAASAEAMLEIETWQAESRMACEADAILAHFKLKS
jgi:hypothetical protein